MALGGKIVPFAGYLLPVQYPTGVIAEHIVNGRPVDEYTIGAAEEQ